MTNTHTLAIHSKGTHATVHLDGTDIAHALTGIALTLGVNKAATATLDLVIVDVTEVQDTEARIVIPDATRDLLVQLGWTAPPEATDQH